MPEKISIENLDDDPQKTEEKAEAPAESAERRPSFTAEQFFEEHGAAIEDYAQDRGLHFRRGKRWTIKMDKGEATYDPAFFSEKGYSAAESMWATCHEIEHFRDWRKDPETYAKLFARIKIRKRLDILYKCLDDIMVNRQVDQRFPSHIETKDGLCRTRLFPGNDYSKKPKHLQFVYAALREKMLPEELLTLSPEVREELEKLKNIDGQGTDLISVISAPDAKPKDRFDIIRDYIEPIYEKFFQKDVADRRAKEDGKKEEGDEKGDGEKKPDSGEQGDEGNEKPEGKPKPSKIPKKGEHYFKDEYDEFDKNSPEVMPADEIKDELDKEVKRRKNQNKSPEEIARAQFEKQHGVSVEQIENYRECYKKIEQYIHPLREIFQRIISTRKEIKRRLKERTDQGVVLDPSLISQAYIDAESGIVDSRTQLKIRKEEFDEHKPSDFEFTLVCDLSHSMSENKSGGKSYEQKLCAILLMEALAEFEEELKKERLEKTLNLHVMTEVRGFGSYDEELKPLGDNIDYQTRVKVASRLENCNGDNTKDFLSLKKILNNIPQETKIKIAKNDLKKIVLLITDGGSDDVTAAKAAKEGLKDAGAIVKGIQIGEPKRGDRAKFKSVWMKPEKDGYPCQDVSKLVSAVEKLLKEFLNDL